MSAFECFTHAEMCHIIETLFLHHTNWTITVKSTDEDEDDEGLRLPMFANDYYGRIYTSFDVEPGRVIVYPAW